MYRALFTVGAMLLPGCATMTRGSTATMTVTTEPAGARCRVVRDNETLGTVAATPGDIAFARKKGALAITCTKPGYQTAQLLEEPMDQQPTMASPLGLAGGLVGLSQLVDSASGAEYRYRGEVIVKLTPDETQPGAAERPPPTLNNLRLR